MALVLESISRSFGTVRALDGVSVSVAPGECRALYGGNGSGKSTMGKIASGILSADFGSIRVDDRSLTVASPAAARDLGVGITFQELSLIPELTAGENVVLADLPRRFGLLRDRKAEAKLAAEELRKVGLARMAEQRVELLQTGERYLVELAKALSRRPRYLIVDELTATMHASEVETFAALLAEFLTNGGGAFFVSHRLPELRRFCDTISVLRNGKLVFDGRLADIGDHELVQWAGGGQPSDAAAITSPHAGETLARLSGIRPLASTPPFDLELRAGEIVGIGGLPDQGQKSFLRLIAGLRTPRAGETVRLGDQPLPIGSSAAVAAKGVSFVSGERDEMVFAQRSIRENMLAPFVSMRGRKLPDDREITAALDRLSTRHAGIHMPIGSLSGGNQQKILVARCLLMNPHLIVAEDCTKGIDVAARSDVHSFLRDLAHRQGAAVVATSSEDQELAELCDRVLVFEGGSVIADLSRSSGTLNAQSIVSAYMKQDRAA